LLRLLKELRFLRKKEKERKQAHYL